MVDFGTPVRFDSSLMLGSGILLGCAFHELANITVGKTGEAAKRNSSAAAESDNDNANNVSMTVNHTGTR